MHPVRLPRGVSDTHTVDHYAGGLVQVWTPRATTSGACTELAYTTAEGAPKRARLPTLEEFEDFPWLVPPRCMGSEAPRRCTAFESLQTPEDYARSPLDFCFGGARRVSTMPTRRYERMTRELAEVANDLSEVARGASGEGRGRLPDKTAVLWWGYENDHKIEWHADDKRDAMVRDADTGEVLPVVGFSFGSAGSHGTMWFRDKQRPAGSPPRKSTKVDLPPGSVVVMNQGCQEALEHKVTMPECRPGCKRKAPLPATDGTLDTSRLRRISATFRTQRHCKGR